MLKQDEALYSILSICRDYLDSYASPKEAITAIYNITIQGLGKWMCRYCKRIFDQETPEHKDFLGEVCFECVARAQLTAARIREEKQLL